jgi:hypothetical protein
MATITSSTSTLPYDREKYLVNKLLEIAEQRLVMKSICDKDSMRKGAGLTAYMVRYKHMSTRHRTISFASRRGCM